MRKTFTALLILLLASLRSLAQAPITVPNEMEFAGVRLKIQSDAKKEIEQTLDLLTRSQYHFQRLVDRSRLYMPYVEEVLRQEGIPEDFKYLPIQESQFVSDTVSSSNAVGFWQFKKASAQELGLRVDNVVDERKHIVAATVGATKYFKRSNFVFDNWVLSLQSYLQGLTGTQRSVDDKLYGAKSMVIDGKTHWYIKKFIAHYLAFKDYVGNGKYRSDMSLHSYEGRGKTLRQVSQATGTDFNELRAYNKWLNQSQIPDDKSYLVFYPDAKKGGPVVVRRDEPQKTNEADKSRSASSNNRSESTTKAETRRMRFRPIAGNVGAFPQITGNTAKAYEPGNIELNGIPAVRAKSNDNLQSLSARTGVKTERLMKFNDIGERGNVRADRYYYLKKKRNKGKVHYHIVQPGETLWGISQDYGIKLKKLMQKNRIKEAEQLKVGRVLWLRFIRPKDIPVEYSRVSLPESTPEPEPEKPVQPERTIQENVRPKTVELPLRDDNEVFIEPTPIRPLTNTARDTVVVHRVRYQETFFAIAKEYAVEIDEILEWNNLKLSDGLQIGQELKLLVPRERYAPKVKEPQIITHQVAKGETMWSISKKYEVEIEDIKRWNNKADHTLSLGEKLIIRKPN
ncbi:LysM peptidoglycan-binding domain-containing protein [Roseivirga thermotolerans]|nr:LysM peptidoglycan-binding domain-containing protein [Roseivirga thermotolerans]